MKHKTQLKPAAVISVLILLLSLWRQEASAQVSVEATSGITTAVTGGMNLTLDGNWTNNGTLTAGNSTVTLNGNGAQIISNATGAFNNLTIYKTGGEAQAGGDFTVTGAMTVTSGDVDLNGKVITLGTAALLAETPGNTVKGASGHLETTRNLNAPGNNNVAGMGFEITSAANLGSTVIKRGHAAQSGNGNQSILRYFDVIPANNSGLNATLVYRYDDSELNGQTEANLELYRSTDGGASWTAEGGAANGSGNSVTQSSIASLSRWTAADQSLVSSISAPEIDVRGNAISIVDGDNMPDTADGTDFGSVVAAPGNFVSRTFTIANTGSADLNLTGALPRVQISGANVSDFTVLVPPASSISPGGATTFTVHFHPDAPGLHTATFSIANDDADENPYEFAVQGTGTGAAEMDVLGNAVSVVDGDVTPSSADHTDFGSADISTGSVDRVFTIANLGNVSLNLTGSSKVQITGANAADFSVTVQPSSPVAASGNTTFTVHFDPSATGLRSATISIANDDADENPYDFVIQGTGTGTANLALNKSATASSSRPGYPPSNAVDGNTSTHWRSDMVNGSTPAWWRVDLGAIYTIDKVVIDWSGSFYARQYQVQISSNDAAWQTVYSDNAGNGGVDNITFSAIAARYVRIFMTRHYEQIERLDEVEVYAASGALAKESEVASNQLSVTSYQLEQNYPNPFWSGATSRFAGNPTTTISFALPEAGEVSLAIYNSMGQLVRKLVAGEMAQGRHSIVWDAKDDHGLQMASGMYLYVIKAGSFSAQRKLILMK